MGAHNFNFAPKFTQNLGLSTQIVHFWMKILGRPKIYGAGVIPQCNDVTGGVS